MVEADDKRQARVMVVETVCATVEAALAARGHDIGDQPAAPTPEAAVQNA